MCTCHVHSTPEQDRICMQKIHVLGTYKTGGGGGGVFSKYRSSLRLGVNMMTCTTTSLLDIFHSDIIGEFKLTVHSIPEQGRSRRSIHVGIYWVVLSHNGLFNTSYNITHCTGVYTCTCVYCTWTVIQLVYIRV